MPILSSRQLDLSSITGSLFGTASYAITASYALAVEGGALSTNLITQGSVTASVQSSGPAFLITSGSGQLMSLTSQGALTLSSSALTPFLIKNNVTDIFKISQNGVVVLTTQSIELTNPAPNGGIYFTSNSFFVGLD